MAIGAQIEEDLSWTLNLLSRTHRDVNSVSALFAHFRFYAYDFLLMFLHLQQLLSKSRDKSDRLTRLYARVYWLDRYMLALLKYPLYPLFILDNGMNLISKSLTVLTPA